MFEFFFKNFSDYLIESTNELLIFLIPGKVLYDNDGISQWLGLKRAEAFNQFLLVFLHCRPKSIFLLLA